MLLVIGTALLAIGFVLVGAAYACHRNPAASPRLIRWVGGETAGVMLTTIPACGVIALFYLMMEPVLLRTVGIIHGVATAAIVAACWFAARSLFRLGNRLEAAQSHPETTALVEADAGIPGAASVPSPERRAA